MTEKHDAILIAGKAISPLVNEALRLREALATARDDALEDAAKAAETEGVDTQSCYQPNTVWFRHGKRIAAAIRSMKGRIE